LSSASVLLISSFCFLFHFLEEIGVVCSNSFRTMMFGAKYLFSDRQGSLIEGQGFLVLALLSVEECQIVEEV